MIKLSFSENVLNGSNLLLFSTKQGDLFTNLIPPELFSSINSFFDKELKVGDKYILPKALYHNYNINSLHIAIFNSYSNEYINIKNFKDLVGKTLDELVSEDITDIVIPDVILNSTFDRKFIGSILVDEFKKRTSVLNITLLTRHKRYLEDVKSLLGGKI
jgi:hypothetical protein